MTSQKHAESVGFIGLGSMGIGLATNLLKMVQQNNDTMHVHNRTAAKADPLLKQGAIWASSPASIGKQCSITFSCVFSDTALREVFTAYLSGHPSQDSLYIDCSTVSPDTIRELDAKAKAAGLTFICAPVFGRPPAAMEGQVLWAPAGPAHALDRLQPYLDAMGRGTMRTGNEAYMASVMKLCGNFFIASVIETTAEGMTLAEKNGVSRDTVLEFISSTFPGQLYPMYAEKIARNRFHLSPEVPGARVEGGLKDVGLIQSLAKECGVQMPLGKLMLDHLKEAGDRGWTDLDWTAVTRVIREPAGIYEEE